MPRPAFLELALFGVRSIPRRSVLALATVVALGTLVSQSHPLEISTWLLAGAVTIALAASWLGEARRQAPDAGANDNLELLHDAAWVLDEKKYHYRELLDEQSDLIVRRDEAGRITFANRAFCRMFAADLPSLFGTSFVPEVLAIEAAPEGQDAAARHRRRELVATSAGERWIEWEEHAVPKTATHAAELHAVGRDVTEQRRVAATLARMSDEANAASRAKSRFLAAMSHEIRTPMNGILGMASLLRDTELSAEQTTYTHAIEQSAQTLLALIDEILDFSKIEAGKLELSSAPFSLASCVQSCVELLAPRAHEKGLEFAWTLDPQFPAQLVGDEARVRQILLNLIGNALKFTDRGGVLVDLGSRVMDGNCHTRIRIKDTGIGVQPEVMERLFTEFSQSDAPQARERGGTGLGLAISRRLARAMGGDIALDSAPGQGATFTVELVLPVPADVGATLVVPGRDARRPQVLLVGERLLERRALATNLRNIGVSVAEAEPDDFPESGRRTADVMLIEAEADPIAAGMTLKRLRAHVEGLSRAVAVIDPQHRNRVAEYRAAGFDSYLVRPVRPQSLLVQTGLATVPLDTEPDDAKPRPVRIHLGLSVLLAEDNPINALLARRMLDSLGCAAVTVGDGAEAIAAIGATLDSSRPGFDLVLMDVHMPRLDGLSAAAELKRISAEPGSPASLPPLVALTANAFPEDRRACLAAGFDDYVSKPFTKEDLLAVMRKWCAARLGQAA